MTREEVALLQESCVVLPALQAEVWSARVGPRWQEYERHQASPLNSPLAGSALEPQRRELERPEVSWVI